MLADKGERSILEVLAKYDPDPSVRETACRYLYRTPAQDQRLQEFLIERLFEDESPIVRRYILQSAMGGFPVLDWNQVQRLLSDVDDDIQAAAFGIISQYDYGWILQDLPVETGVAVVRDAFFDWLLWETGYQAKETIEAEIEGLRIAYVYLQRLVKIAKQLPDVEIAHRSGWIKDMHRPDRRPTNNEERKDALSARLRELDREQAIDFVTEVFVGWASGQQNSSEIVRNLES